MTSKVIDFLRFPLIFGVLLIHSVSLPDTEAFRGYDLLYSLLSVKVGKIMVPTFFLISGYLFFLNMKTYDLHSFLDKYKKRCKSLVLPYLLWNIITALIILIGQISLPSLFTGAFASIKDLTLKGLLSVFWDFQESGKPIAFQLWFLRSLILAVTLAPAFYAIVRYLPKWLSLGVFVAVLFVPIRIPYLGTYAISFFGIGSWLGIFKIDFAKVIKPYGLFFCIIFMAGLIINSDSHSILENVLFKFNILIGIITFVYIAIILIEKNIKIPLALKDCSFFLYCYHGILAQGISRIIIRSNIVTNDYIACFSYIAIPITITIIGSILYNLGKKYIPQIIAILCGER